MDLKYYIGYSIDPDIRFHSSSGGIGSALIKYLLESDEYGTAMTFYFNKERCQYDIKLIYDFSCYNNCGSIYQDTDTITFIRENISNIRNGIIVTCMPCQVKPIRSLLNRNKIKHFIISLCCSGQTTVQGTMYYYKLLGIHKKDVKCIRYRGNGWPSGIQIELNSGEIIRKKNYTYPWTIMHESLLFRPKRCLSCTIKTSSHADISLADPWLKEYIKNDKLGNTVVISNEAGNVIITKMTNTNLLWLNEIDEETYIKSQLGTIKTKSTANKYKKFNRIIARMGRDDSWYKRIFTSSIIMMKLHFKILGLLKLILK